MSKSISLLKKTTAVTLSLLVALSTLFSFSLTADAAAKKYVKSIKVKSKSVTITKGKSKKVKVSVSVVKKASKKFTVKSSKKSVATAKVSGSYVKISAKKAGKATITVTTKAKGKKGKKLSAKIKVKVKEAEEPVYESDSSIYNPFAVQNGASASLFDLESVFSTYADSINKDATMFASDDDSIVSVSSKGVITGHKLSDIPVAIRVLIVDNSGKTHQFYTYVTVVDGTIPTSPETPTQPATNPPETNPPVTNPPATNPPVSSDIGIASFGATHAKIFTVRFTAPVKSSDRSKLDITLKKGSATLSLDKEWADDYTVNLTASSVIEATNYTVSISSTDLSIDAAKKSASCSVEKNEIKAVAITTKRIAKVNNVRIYFDAIDNYGDKMENTSADKFNWQISCDDAKVKTGLINVSTSNKDCIVLTNFGSDSIGIEADSSVINVQAIYKTDANIKSGGNSISVNSLKIAKVEIQGIALTDGASRIYQETVDKTYKLLYTAVDQYGDPVDWAVYHPGSSNNAYSNTFNAFSSNTDLVSAPMISDNELSITVKANKSGSAQIYAVADGDPKIYNIEVLAAANAQSINFPDSSEYSAVAGEDKEVKVPVTFTDQYGDTMVKGAVSSSKFNSIFSSVKSDNNLIVGYTSNNEGDFVTFNAKNISSADTKSVTITFQAYDKNNNLVSSKFVLKVDPERAPATIAFTKDFPDGLLVGEQFKAEYIIMDNRSEQWKSNSNLTVVVDIVDTTYLSGSYSSVASDGTGSITIKGKAESTVNSDPYVKFKIRLVYKSETVAETTRKVIVYPNLSDIKMNVSPTTVNAGQKVTLTLRAYKNSTTLLDGYNRKYTDLIITQTDGSTTKTDFMDVEFINGVATIQVNAKIAAESVKFSTQISVAGGSTMLVQAAETVKVNPGDIYDYNVTAKKVINYTKVTVTATDQYGNTVTNYAPGSNSYITIKDKNGNSLDPTNYFSSSVADSEGRLKISFTDGVAEISTMTSKPLPTGAVVTVKTGSVTGSATA